MEFSAETEGWQVWHSESQKLVLTFRPDVFDSDAFPAPCLPTIYTTKGRRGRRPGPHHPSPEDAWYVTLYLEPDVSDEWQYDSQRTASEETARLATRFETGEYDYRSLYQVPRPAYLDKLDELTGKKA